MDGWHGVPIEWWWFVGLCSGVYAFYQMVTTYPDVTFGCLFGFLGSLAFFVLPLDWKNS